MNWEVADGSGRCLILRYFPRRCLEKERKNHENAWSQEPVTGPSVDRRASRIQRRNADYSTTTFGVMLTILTSCGISMFRLLPWVFGFLIVTAI
jgi:hypothetical protein